LLPRFSICSLLYFCHCSHSEYSEFLHCVCTVRSKLISNHQFKLHMNSKCTPVFRICTLRIRHCQFCPQM
jgi:hypothetical protein